MMESDDEGEVSRGMVGMLFKNRYLVLKYLGSGGFSRIWLVYDVLENRYAAMKVQFPEDYKEAVKEKETMMQLGNNRYCMELYDTFDQVFEGKTFFCFILELLGPDLYKITENKKPIPLYAVKQIIFEMLKGIDYIHSKKYIHTDLKPENVLMVNYSPKVQRVVDWFNSLKPQELFSMIKTSLLPSEYTVSNKAKKKKIRDRVRVQAVKKFQNAMFSPIIEEISKYWDLSDDEFSDNSDGESDNGSDNDNGSENDNNNNENDNGSDNDSGSENDNGSDNGSDNDSDNDSDSGSDDEFEPIPIISKNGQYIKIGDFGLSEKIEDNPEDIQTLQFRAPEVILVFDRVNEKSDIWSLGCIAYELLACKTLFRIEETDEKLQDFEHLYLMNKYIGKMPVDFIDEGNVSDEYFTNAAKPKFKNKKYREMKASMVQKPLKILLEERNLEQFKNEPVEFEMFCNFLTKCFRYWPKQRPSAKELLQDDWFNSAKVLQLKQTN